MITAKLTTTLLGIAAGLTLVALPQTAQAQNSIAITGGTVDVGSPNPYPVLFITNNQGTFSGNAHLLGPAVCNGCFVEYYMRVSGSGFSPTGPVMFSSVPVVVQITTGGTIRPIQSGTFNSTTVGSGTSPQVAVNTTFNNGGITGPLASPNFSVGQFHFTDPFPAPAAPAAPAAPTFETLKASTQNFTIPDPISLQTGEGQAEAIFQAAQQQSLRPNGMHTRIIPAWTPGLYQ